MNSRQLATQAIKGDSAAFIQLVKQHESSLYYMAHSILRQDADVADVLQETILKAFKSISALREPKHFKTWIFRILINECNSLLAGRSRSVAYADVPNVASTSGDYDHIDLREAVDRLEEPQRIVIILFYFEDLPLRQVAEVLGLSESAVKMRLSRARETLLRNFTIPAKGEISYESI